MSPVLPGDIAGEREHRMAATDNRRIVSMNDAALMPRDPAEDIRGRTVVDADGNEIGHVEDLMLDEDESKVRFLQIGAGGFLGLGERKFLVPVDAISAIDDDAVRVDRSREHIIAAPPYNPALVDDDSLDLWERAYAHYGYAPFWGEGYMYPGYPFYGGLPPEPRDQPVSDDADDPGESRPEAGERSPRDTRA